MTNQPQEIDVHDFRKKEKDIWLLFKMGDKEAYASIYRQNAELLFRYGRKVIYDRDMIKDCIHDLFVELWKNRSRVGNPPCVKNYLVKCLRNKLSRQIKRNMKVVYREELLSEGAAIDLRSTESEVIEQQTNTHRSEVLRNAMKKLSNRQKEIIFLIYYSNFSASEVAEIMSLSVRTVYNTAFNAVQQLRKDMIPIVLLLVLSLFL